MKGSAIAVAVIVLAMGSAMADEMASGSAPPSNKTTPRGQPALCPGGATPQTPPGKYMSPYPVPDYTSRGSWLTWPRMTGDWAGARTCLAENGLTFELDVTNIVQTNTRGGRRTTNGSRYSGIAEYTLKLDTGRAGLWPAGLILVRGKTKFGNGINPKVGTLANFGALTPLPLDACITTLSEAYIVQPLSEHLVVLAGKIDGSTVIDKNEFAGNEKTQFMNTMLRLNTVLLPFAPYTSWAAGVRYTPTKWLSSLTAVADTNGGATVVGFDTAFHSPRGATFVEELTFSVKPLGLKGSHVVGIHYSTKEFTVLDLGRADIFLEPGRGLIIRPDTRPDDWALAYNFSQYLFSEPGDPTQGVGIFGRYGWTSGEANLVHRHYSFGVGGKGIIPGRDNDRFGVGYYFLKLSEDLPRILNKDSEQGIEIFYNFQITPSMTVTPDLQIIIDPGADSRRDTAVIAGVRVQMSF